MRVEGLPVRLNIIWNSIGSIVYFGCQWLLTVLITRISGYGVAGDFSLAVNITNIFYCIALFGMKTFQISDLQNKYRTGTYFSSRIVTGLLGFVSCIIFTLCYSFSIEQKIIISCYMVFKIVEATFDVFVGVFQKHSRMDQIGKSLIIRGIVSLIVFVSLQILMQNLVISILGMAFSSAIFISIWDRGFAMKLEKIKIDWEFESLQNLLISCIPLVLYAIIDTSIVSLPRIFLEHFHDNVALGYYIAVATPAIIIQMIADYIYNPLITHFALYYYEKNAKAFKHLLLKSMLTLFGISALGITGAIFLGDWGLALIFGSSILPYTYLLLPAMFCALLVGVVRFLNTIMTIIRKLMVQLVVNIITLVGSIVLSILLIPSMSMQGVNVVIAAVLLFEFVMLFVCIVVLASNHFKSN